MNIPVPANRKVKVIDPHKQPRIRCEECGRPEMHIYKQDPSLYFCGNCAHKVPIQNVKHSVVVVPPPRAEEGTFITQSPRQRQPDSAVNTLNKKKGPVLNYLRNQGYDISDYVEITHQPD